MIRLKQIREAKGLSQLTLGMKVGVSQETISGYEIDKASPPADMLIKLADTLGTSIDYLLERTDEGSRARYYDAGLTETECKLIQQFRQLAPSRQERVMGVIIGAGLID